MLVDGAALEADSFVFALGPWSVLLEDWMPGQAVPLQGVQSTSIVVAPSAGVAEGC